MKFKVNNTTWDLKHVHPNSNSLMRSDGTITLGVCDNNLKTVFINNRLSEYMFDKVLCHELVHVYCFEYDIHLPIDTEEIIADFMSLYGRKIIYLADSIMSDVIWRAV